MYSQNGFDVLCGAIDGEQSLSANEIGEILCCTQLSREVWTKLEKMDSQIADYYWENVQTSRLQDTDGQAMEYYIEKLLHYKCLSLK